MHPLSKYDLVYLGTPYTKFPGGIEAAFVAACELTARLLRAGVKVYSPIAHTHPVAIHGSIDPLDHKIWLPFDEAIMRKADAMAVAELPTWASSYGIAHEIGVFVGAGKPVIHIDPVTLVVKDQNTKRREAA